MAREETDTGGLPSPWELEALLSEGGLRRTCIAINANNGTRAVIKELEPDHVREPKHAELFDRECEIMGMLSHPQIPRLIDVITTTDGSRERKFMIQEYVEGTNLLDLVSSGAKMPTDEVVGIMRSVLTVLEYMHEHEPAVLHRDIKPANLVVRPNRSVALVDFGSATHADLDQESRTSIVGTFGYMPPEQFQAAAFPSSDMYALAFTALQMLTGLEPARFELRDMTPLFRKHYDEDPSFAAILDIMLDPDPERRYGNARSLLGALARWSDDTGTSPSVPLIPAPPVHRRKNATMRLAAPVFAPGDRIETASATLLSDAAVRPNGAPSIPPPQSAGILRSRPPGTDDEVVLSLDGSRRAADESEEELLAPGELIEEETLLEIVDDVDLDEEITQVHGPLPELSDLEEEDTQVRGEITMPDTPAQTLALNTGAVRKGRRDNTPTVDVPVVAGPGEVDEVTLDEPLDDVLDEVAEPATSRNRTLALSAVAIPKPPAPPKKATASRGTVSEVAEATGETDEEGAKPDRSPVAFQSTVALSAFVGEASSRPPEQSAAEAQAEVETATPADALSTSAEVEDEGEPDSESYGKGKTIAMRRVRVGEEDSADDSAPVDATVVDAAAAPSDTAGAAADAAASDSSVEAPSELARARRRPRVPGERRVFVAASLPPAPSATSIPVEMMSGEVTDVRPEATLPARRPSLSVASPRERMLMLREQRAAQL